MALSAVGVDGNGVIDAFRDYRTRQSGSANPVTSGHDAQTEVPDRSHSELQHQSVATPAHFATRHRIAAVIARFLVPISSRDAPRSAPFNLSRLRLGPCPAPYRACIRHPE